MKTRLKWFASVYSTKHVVTEIVAVSNHLLKEKEEDQIKPW